MSDFELKEIDPARSGAPIINGEKPDKAFLIIHHKRHFQFLPNKHIGIGDLPLWHISSIWSSLYFTDNPFLIWVSWCIHILLIEPYFWAKNRKDDRFNSQQTKSETP